MRYSVRLASDGTSPIASSSPDGDVVAVGSGKPMRAFQVALKTMKEGEKVTMKIKPECEHQPPFEDLQYRTLSLHSWAYAHATRPHISSHLLFGFVQMGTAVKTGLQTCQLMQSLKRTWNSCSFVRCVLSSILVGCL